MSSALSGIEGIRAEDFERIVRANQQRIFRVLYSLVRDRDAADTLTQECFLRAYRKRHSFRGEANVSTWLVRIAINLARDYGRNQRLAFWRKLFAVSGEDRHGPPAAHIPDPTPSPERVLLAREQLQSVWTAVEQLPQQQRAAFALRFIAEMSLGEIADVMDLEVGTVKAHLFRAVSAIRKGVRGQKES
ncbi:MAG: sigma-70 family RNA polymerase sigma factor [Acidobacteriia bacterium]|nr:sigma-70 family RNA polymerase sigma factor [Terriglobia bacterium]